MSRPKEREKRPFGSWGSFSSSSFFRDAESIFVGSRIALPLFFFGLVRAIDQGAMKTHSPLSANAAAVAACLLGNLVRRGKNGCCYVQTGNIQDVPSQFFFYGIPWEMLQREKISFYCYLRSLGAICQVSRLA